MDAMIAGQGLRENIPDENRELADEAVQSRKCRRSHRREDDKERE